WRYGLSDRGGISMGNKLSREENATWHNNLPTRICAQDEHAGDPGKCKSDERQRPGGGGDVSLALQDRSSVEKGVVNFSAVHGKTPEQVLKTLRVESEALDFFATGVSIVLHPKSPMVPIIHMNVRYFELSNGKWWFGGGIDVTPHYVNEEDARYFHSSL